MRRPRALEPTSRYHFFVLRWFLVTFVLLSACNQGEPGVPVGGYCGEPHDCVSGATCVGAWEPGQQGGRCISLCDPDAGKAACSNPSFICGPMYQYCYTTDAASCRVEKYVCY